MQNLAQWIERQSRTVATTIGLIGKDIAGSVQQTRTQGVNPRALASLLGLAFIVLIGWINLRTAPGLDLELVYLLGCAVVGWVAGVRPALFCTFASAIFLCVVEKRHGLFVSSAILTWNSAFRLLAFAAICWLAAEVSKLTRHLELKVQQRTASLQSEVDEHKSTAGLLRETMQLFKQVTENVANVFWVTDPAKTHYQYVSPEFEKVWGRAPQALYRSPDVWLEGIHPDDRERVSHAASTKQVGGGYTETYRVLREGGSLRWVHDRAFPVKNELGKVYRIVGIVEDITERFRLERQILEISDREKARIGQDIHDGLCQQLVGLAFDANSLEQALTSQRSPEAGIARRIAALLDEAITESRRVARGLYPVRLEKEGLVPALKDLADAIADRFKVRCSCCADSPDLVCDDTMAIHFYRIAQEAVHNALKHSGALNVSIQLIEKDDRIDLTVEDDGRGIEPEAERSSGMGLYTMSYRAQSMGGSLQVMRRDRGGTRVSCRVPRKTT